MIPPRVLLATILLTFGAVPAIGQQAGFATTVIIVRHAERLDASTDSPLNVEGEKRAAALVTVLDGARVTSILATQYRRTQATAEPFARISGLRVEALPVGATHAKDVADSVRARVGGVILVVGHSNTVGPIIEALGAKPPPPICDSEYDDLFVVTIPVSGEPSVVRARYGEVSTRGVGCPRGGDSRLGH